MESFEVDADRSGLLRLFGAAEKSGQDFDRQPERAPLHEVRFLVIDTSIEMAIDQLGVNLSPATGSPANLSPVHKLGQLVPQVSKLPK